MAVPPRSSSVVDSAASAAESIRHQRQEALSAIDRRGAAVAAWLEEAIQSHTNHLLSLQVSGSDGAKELPALPEDLIQWIKSLKVKDLQNELRDRDLNATGLKKDLRERLIRSMEEEQRAKVPSPEPVAQPPVPPGAAAEDAAPIPDAMDISMEKTSAEPQKKEEPSRMEPEHADTEPVAMETELALHSQPPKEDTIARTRPSSIQPPKPRSPLRKMQTSVQSALQSLRPVSPTKACPEETKSPPKPKHPVVAMPASLVAEKSETKKSGQSATSTTSSSGPLSAQSSNRSLLKTPALGSATSSTTLGSSAGMHSGSVQAKQDARKARIAEIRSKYEQTKPTLGASKIPAVGALKSSSALKSDGETNGKRKLLTAQMRDKALGNLGEAAPPNNSSVAPPKPATAKAGTILAPSSSGGKNKSNGKQKVMSSPPASAKPARSPILSPLDTYDMSDHEGSDSDDEDDERNRRAQKRVPAWAQKENLKQSLHHQFTKCNLDPDDFFGEVTTCNLEAVFGKKRSKYQRRTSSGCWTKDRATAAEKLAFKRDMGYAGKA